MTIGSGSLPVGLPMVPVAQIIAKIAKYDTNSFILNFVGINRLFTVIFRTITFTFVLYLSSVYRKKKEEGSILWQYRFWSFQRKDTKSEMVLAKNQL